MIKDYRFKAMLFEAGEDNTAGEGDNAAGGDDTGNAAGENKNTAGKDGNKGNKGESEPEKKYTDADIDRIINKKFAEWQKKQEKAVDEATKLAQMDAQQKAEYERDQLKAELEELKAANTRAQMTVTARGILQEKGVTVPDTVVDKLIGKDADDTKATVDAFAEAFQKAVTDAVKELNKHGSPKTGGGTKMTRDEIMNIADRVERQKLIAENRDLFISK